MTGRDPERRLRRTEESTAASLVNRGTYERQYMLVLGQRLRTLREERGLTQQVVARAAGVATDMVSRLENGHYTSPGLRTVLRIADGMGLSVGALLPDLPASGGSSPEAALRARLVALLHRAEPDDLELIVDIAATILHRHHT
jgi:transcriptional regulator with XRE-family HTH domain